MPVGDLLPELILLVGAIGVLLVALFTPRRFQPALVWLSLGVVAGATLATLAQLGRGEGLTFFDTWALDGTAVAAKLIVLASAALVVSMTPQWFRSDHRAGEYQTMLLFATLSGAVLASASDLLELTVGLLLSSVTGYVLTAFHRRSKEAAEAAIKYYLLGALANATFLYGVLLLFGLSGSTTYPAVAAVLPAADRLGVIAALVLAAVGLAFKVGAAPVHAWVPDVAQGAPAPSAAFLMVVPKVAGMVAILRFAVLFVDTGIGWRPLLALLAAVTMTLGNLAALWQDDLRRLLGWSAVSQTGYALMAPVALGRSDLAIASLLLFLAAYAAATLAAFGVVVELRGRTVIADYAGLARARPWLYTALVIAFLSMVGIPPLGGFAGKLAVFAATIDAGYAWLALLAVANTAVSLFYYVRVIGPGYTDPAPAEVPILGRSSAVAVTLATVAVVAIGVAAQPLLEIFGSASVLP